MTKIQISPGATVLATPTHAGLDRLAAAYAALAALVIAGTRLLRHPSATSAAPHPTTCPSTRGTH